MPEEISFTVLGELFQTYIVVQQGEEALLIDKHAAHERILFDRLRAQKQEIASQTLLAPQTCRLGQEGAALLLAHLPLLDELGYGVEEFGEGTVLLRRAPMDLAGAGGRLPRRSGPGFAGGPPGRPGQPAGSPPAYDGLQSRHQGRVAHGSSGAGGFGAGGVESAGFKALPHGRPVCIRLTRQQLERQFGRA